MATSKKLVSVIMVNFNGGEVLIDCVKSVLRSSAEVEVIVFDNHSDDNSIARLKACGLPSAQVKILEHNENIGFSRGANRAYALSKGEYALFLNPDCIIKDDTIARMTAVMETDSRAGMAGCLIRNKDGTEQSGGRRMIPTPLISLVHILHLQKLSKFSPRAFPISLSLAGSPLPESPVSVEAISGAFMFVRRDAIEGVGRLDEGYFLHCEDLDWCARFARKGYKILFVPDLEILHYKGQCSQGRELRIEWHKHRGMIRFYRKFYSEKYPLSLMWAVYFAVFARFGAMALTIVSKRCLNRLPVGDQNETA